MSQAFIAIIDDRSARGVHLSNFDDRAFPILCASYQDRNRAEVLVAFGDMMALSPEPSECRFYAFRDGLPKTGKTLERLMAHAMTGTEQMYLFDARTEPPKFVDVVSNDGYFYSGRTIGAWTEFNKSQPIAIPSIPVAA